MEVCACVRDASVTDPICNSSSTTRSEERSTPFPPYSSGTSCGFLIPRDNL